ncbi:hypothetical protein O6H91_08G099700 [Diphasiastrum complanatum]|uniref:Uncharacterized protein n=1 Tax=Diphasiastrum complanatum TaxID=34168 RepID=A0ACC2D0F2_DIPCM|nr:hypothetical protein O6H91_08G099700 [Diphasiastrum complanatum]
MVDTGKEEQKCDEDLIGRTVKKLFTGYGYFNGKVISFNCRSGYYRVKYDDGDREELELHELKEILADVKNDLAASERPASASRKRLHENDRVEVCGQTEERKLRSKQREVRNKKSKSSSKEIIVGEITTRNSGGDLVNTVAVDVLNGLIKEETAEQTEEPSSSTRSCRSRQLGGPNSQNPPHDEEKGKRGEDQLSKKDNGISKKRLLETPVPDGKSPASRASKRLRECKIPSTPLQQILVSGDKEVGTKVDSSDEDCEESESSGIEEHQKSDSQVQALEVPPLRPLPPSSTDLPIPIESVADLFEVFTFLRSFSWVLFLSPFLLKDFAACLVLKEANGMIDSVHVSLLRLLQRHLERLAADGSKMATIVLRHRDWNFLDSVTWPSYLVAFLLTHGFSKEHGKSLLQLGLGKTEYYRVETTTKLATLSFLCQKALETDEIRAEIATRADLEAEIDLDDTKIHTPKSNTWANWRALTDLSVKRSISFDTDSEQANDKSIGLRTRCLSRSVSYDQGSNIQRIQKSNDGGKRHNGLVARFKEPKDITSPTRNLEQLQDDCDLNSDECVLCGMDGNLICCDGCPAAYHSRCIGLCKLSLPDGDWYCPECIIEQQNENLQLRKSLRGSQFLGMDPHGRVYTATCGYLLVSETSSESNAVQSYYYAYPDLPLVLEFLELCGPVFKEIERGIHQLWRFSHDLSGGTTLIPKNELRNADQQPEILNTLSKEMQEFPSLMSSLSKGPSVEMTVFETQISDTKISSPVPKQLTKFGPNSHMAVTNSALVHAQVEIACCNSIINAIQEPKQGVIAPEITTMEQVLEVVDIEKANDMSQLKPLVVPDIGKSNDRCTGGVLLKRLEQAAENLTVGGAFGNKAITGIGSKTFILVEQVDMADSKAGDILNNADIGILSADSSKTVEQVDKDPTVDKESACNAESGKFENNFEKDVVTLHQCKEDSNTEMDINQKLERGSEGHGQGVLVYDSAQLGQHETCQFETKLPAIEIHTGDKVSKPRHEDLEDNNAAWPSLRLSQNSNILVDQEHLGSPPSASVLQKVTRVRARSQLQEDFLEDDRSSKAYLFVNHYILGDAAASAAANFITASAGEKQALEGTGSQKKAWATLQMKAFSEAPVTFYWPSTKKKLMETPKERCGWCFACQSPNRKTCFLNQVAKKLSAGAALILGGIRSIKKGHDHLPAVASYMLYMEDNIHGLLVGPWEKTEQRRRWRKRVEQAASIHDIKAALLEMGCGLRMVALNNDWSKIVEDAPELIPSSVVAASVAGVSVKKAPGGRRGRREVPHVEKGTISVGGSAWGIHWWRGGRLARNFLDWETLPCATIRKASRQDSLLGCTYKMA